MQRAGAIRIAISLLVCFSMFFYNITGFFKPLNTVVYSAEAVDSVIPQASQNVKEEPASKEEESANSSTEKTEEKAEENNTSTQSITVSAEDIKGKIISNYISPYNASQSYNKIYMKNSTGVSVDIKKLSQADLKFSINKNSESPQVLIVHTHATESFMMTDSDYYTDDFSPRSKDNTKNMVKIGEIVAEKLNSAGIKTLHDKTQHDYPEYTGSYTKAAATIKSYLKKYPDIKIVLDLHRDSVSSGESDKVKLVTEIDGKKAAQVMLVMGSNTGGITSYPNWQENLKLAFKLQQKLEENYPTLARPLMLASKLYNQNLTTGSLLIEFGTDANSLSEVTYSAELVGSAISELLSELD